MEEQMIELHVTVWGKIMVETGIKYSVWPRPIIKLTIFLFLSSKASNNPQTGNIVHFWYKVISFKIYVSYKLYILYLIS